MPKRQILSYNETIEKITEGCSGDEKYMLEKDGNYFLLRVGDIAKSTERKDEYNRLFSYAGRNVRTHQPIAFDTTIDKFYSIVSWVKGIPIMNIIKNDVSRDYHQLGQKVGMELQKLHSVSQSAFRKDWLHNIEKKADLFLDNFHHMNVDFACSQNAEQYILKNLCLMSDRPQVALHGDFHWNNCVVDEAGNVGIIDFSGNSTGDPWYDFGGTLWALEYSESFVNGQIDGYFGTPPDHFWKVFKYYVALYAFEHFMYSSGTSEDIKNRIHNAERMLRIFGESYELEVPLFRQKYLNFL